MLAVLRQEIDGLDSHGAVVVGIAVDVLMPQHILATGCRCPGPLVFHQLILHQMGPFRPAKVPDPLKGPAGSVCVGEHLVHAAIGIKGQQGVGIGGNLYDFCGQGKVRCLPWGRQAGFSQQLPVGLHQSGVAVFRSGHQLVVDASVHNAELVVPAEGLGEGLDVDLLWEAAVDVGGGIHRFQGDGGLMVEAGQLGSVAAGNHRTGGAGQEAQEGQGKQYRHGENFPHTFSVG